MELFDSPPSAQINLDAVLLGDEKAIDEAIGILAHKVEQVAKHICAEDRRRTNHWDDLISEGLLAVTELVRTRDLSDIRNLEAYAHQMLIYKLQRYLKYIRMQQSPFDLERIQYEENDLTDVYETLDAICDTEQERLVLTLRETGKTDEQVSEILGLSRRRVTQIRNELHERYKARD